MTLPVARQRREVCFAAQYLTSRHDALLMVSRLMHTILHAQQALSRAQDSSRGCRLKRFAAASRRDNILLCVHHTIYYTDSIHHERLE